MEKSIPKKMRSWNYGNPHFIILRDNDGGDCFAVKRRLRATAQRWNRPFHVRIVCQELESWLLGDFNAIKRAYPRIAGVSNRPKFRNPDDLTNPSQQLDSLVNERAKIRRAKNISQHFDLTANRSKNLNVLSPPCRQKFANGAPLPQHIAKSPRSIPHSAAWRHMLECNSNHLHSLCASRGYGNSRYRWRHRPRPLLQT